MKILLFIVFLDLIHFSINAQTTPENILQSFDHQTRKLERKNKATILSKKSIIGDLNNDKKEDVIIEVSFGAKNGNSILFKTAYIFLSENETFAKPIEFSPSYCMEVTQILDNQFYVNEFDQCIHQANRINQHIFILHHSEVLELIETK